MTIVNDAFELLFGTSLKRSAGLTSGWPFLGFGGASTKAGQKINSESSLKISAFWCGVNTIASSLAILPKHIMQDKGGRKLPVIGHPVDYIIHRQPNNFMTAFSFWFSFAICILLKGNGYACIVRNAAGAIIRLVLWDPSDVTPIESGGELFYRHKGEKLPYLAADVFHVPNFCLNGINGRSVLQYAGDSMGVSLAADEFAASAYSDGGLSFGVLETEKELNTKGKENIRKIHSRTLDAGDKHKLAVFDEGMKYKRISITPQESEFIKAKATGVEDIARWLNIPLHKLHAPGEGGYNFLVQMSIEYLQSAVMPLGQKIKEEAQRKLLSPKENETGFYVFMNYRKLLEADPKARAQYYKDLFFVKAINSNEIRALEDMNPYEGGDEFLQMSNLLSQAEINKKLQDA